MTRGKPFKVGDTLLDGRKILDVDASKRLRKYLVLCATCNKNTRWSFTSNFDAQCLECFGRGAWAREGQDRRVHRILTNARSCANQRKWSWNLSDEEALRIIQSDCTWCGIGGPGGIDRLDSSIGYEPNNAVPSCRRCNVAKNDMSLDEWRAWIKRIASHNRH